MLNAWKGICGEFVFRAHYKHGFVWFSTLPGMLATEVVLDAYTASWEPENHKLQLENGLHDTRECGKSQSPYCAHCTCPYVSVGPLQMSTCPCSLMLSAQVQFEQQYADLEIWHFHCPKGDWLNNRRWYSLKMRWKRSRHTLNTCVHARGTVSHLKQVKELNSTQLIVSFMSLCSYSFIHQFYSAAPDVKLLENWRDRLSASGGHVTHWERHSCF